MLQFCDGLQVIENHLQQISPTESLKCLVKAALIRKEVVGDRAETPPSSNENSEDEEEIDSDEYETYMKMKEYEGVWE